MISESGRSSFLNMNNTIRISNSKFFRTIIIILRIQIHHVPLILMHNGMPFVIILFKHCGLSRPIDQHLNGQGNVHKKWSQEKYYYLIENEWLNVSNSTMYTMYVCHWTANKFRIQFSTLNSWDWYMYVYSIFSTIYQTINIRLNSVEYNFGLIFIPNSYCICKYPIFSLISSIIPMNWTFFMDIN